MFRMNIKNNTALLQICLIFALVFYSTVSNAVSLSKYSQLNQLAQRLGGSDINQEQIIKGWLIDAEIKHRIIEIMNRPSEGLPWHRYESLFVNTSSVKNGKKFLKRYATALNKAEKIYGVPSEIIVAIIGIETRYGKVMGNFRVLDSLVTLSQEFPRRSKFFFSELENFLRLVQEKDLNPLTLRGSYAGAMGIPQFMPSSYRAYAIDFDGDGHTNLIDSVEDAIGSVANYLAKHKWKRDHKIVVYVTEPPVNIENMVDKKFKPSKSILELRSNGLDLPGDNQKVAVLRFEGETGPKYKIGFHNFFVITKYNRSQNYAMSVFKLAEQIAKNVDG